MRLLLRTWSRSGRWMMLTTTTTTTTTQKRMLYTEGLSFRTGPEKPPLYNGTIPQHFAETVSRHGDKTAVVARSPSGSETRLTYHMLDLVSNRLAWSLLEELGVSRGDRVAVSLGNTAEFAALTYACYKIGAILVPLNPSFNAEQVESALRHLQVRVLIMGAVTDLAYKPGRGRSNQDVLTRLVGGENRLRLRHGDGDGGVVQSEAVPSLQRVVVVDNRADHQQHVRLPLEKWTAVTAYETLLEGSDRAVGGTKAAASLDANDTINIQFTSGTTSMPKAAMLSHRSILNNGILIADRMGLDASDRIVVPPPLFHCFGCVLGYMATATTGAAILFASPAFDPSASLRMCVDHQATGLYGVSTMLVSVLEALDRREQEGGEGGKAAAAARPMHLRKGIVAGSSVPESLMKKIYSRLGLRDVVICYGMTETSPVSCMTSPRDPPQKRSSSVGTPMPHTMVKIVSPADRSRILPLGTRGELAAAGYLVMKGYFGDEAQTAKVRVAERISPSKESEASEAPEVVWMYSGDEAEMDKDGFVTITGRIKDIIIRAGENIHPLEVEDCLLQLPGVHDVGVVGVPDDRLGESVAAFVVRAAPSSSSSSPNRDGASLTEEAVRGWVRERLSGHLVPKHVFWVDDLPKTASGKVQKFKLRDLAVDRLKSGQDS